MPCRRLMLSVRSGSLSHCTRRCQSPSWSTRRLSSPGLHPCHLVLHSDLKSAGAGAVSNRIYLQLRRGHLCSTTGTYVTANGQQALNMVAFNFLGTVGDPKILVSICSSTSASAQVPQPAPSRSCRGHPRLQCCSQRAGGVPGDSEQVRGGCLRATRVLRHDRCPPGA